MGFVMLNIMWTNIQHFGIRFPWSIVTYIYKISVLHDFCVANNSVLDMICLNKLDSQVFCRFSKQPYSDFEFSFVCLLVVLQWL